MYRSKSIVLSLAAMSAFLFVTSDCKADITTRCFRMGFTGFPSDITLEAVLEARRFSRQNADILAHHIEGVPWVESLHDKPFSEEMMNNWKGKLQATPQGGKVYLAISPGRGELKVADKALPLPDELKGKSYNHPLVKKAFLNYTRRAIEFFKPDYLSIGIEVNEIYQKSPKIWKDYVDLYRYIYDVIEKEQPHLPIFASFSLHNLLTASQNDQTKNLAAFDEIMDKCDLVAVSFYPFIAGGTTDLEKAFRWLSDHFDKYEKPYAIVETGEAADKLKFPTTGQIIDGTPQKQANYYKVLLDVAQKKDFEFVISFLHKDYDAMWEKIKTFSPEVFMAWRDCGLLDEDAKPRPAYKIWKEYFDIPLEKTIYGFRLDDIDGNEIELSAYKGKTLLIVNVASKCGFTKQYAPLQELYEKYRSKGLIVLGFPANNFGTQEPGTNEQIKSFCTYTFNVTFPMFAKISVKGKDIHPLYGYLTGAQTNPGFDGDIKWNFNKFLIDRHGKCIGRYDSAVEPLNSLLEKDITLAIE